MGPSIAAEQQARAKYTRRMRLALGWSLLLAIFSLVNLLLIVMKSSSYMLFSAFVPYILGLSGMFRTGHMPAASYEGLEIGEFAPLSFLVWMVAAGIVITALYFLFWALARKRNVFLLAILALYLIDTAVLLWFSIGNEVSYLPDFFIHAVAIFVLARGALAAMKLQRLPTAEEGSSRPYGAYPAPSFEEFAPADPENRNTPSEGSSSADPEDQDPPSA